MKRDCSRRTGVGWARQPVPLLGLTCLCVAVCQLPSSAAEARGLSSFSSTPRHSPEVVGGVPLVPTTKAQRDNCEKFASRLKRPAPCPGLLPDPLAITPMNEVDCLGEVGAFSETSCGTAAIQVSLKELFLSQANFQVPPSYVGVSDKLYNGTAVPQPSINGGPLGHFVFETGTTLLGEYKPGTIKAASSIPSYCSKIQDAPTVKIRGSKGTFYQCSDSSSDRNAMQALMGHDMLQWKQAGLLCQVSFHGHSSLNLKLDVAVARSTEVVQPSH